ncbi:hypothetical protein OE88DRAFT_1735790 [Heliocybe sulcata]|uniref:Uncharacterized protein n=1 Tax=Heliocybe sulcata TaxID=5364 RepID=A0A5C3N014_9AGAM|nr:hypothetical protein OE88DRAFT_1735790 [Heliocybe sulcata]
MPTICEVTVDDLSDDMRKWLDDTMRERAQSGYKDPPRVIEGMLWVVWQIGYIPRRGCEGNVGGQECEDDEEMETEDDDERDDGAEHEEGVDDAVEMCTDENDQDAVGTTGTEYVTILQDAIDSLRLPASYKDWLNRMIATRLKGGYSISDPVIEGMQWVVSEACYVAGEYPEDDDVTIADEDSDDDMESRERNEAEGDDDGREVGEREDDDAPEGIHAPARLALQTNLTTNRHSTVMEYVDENIPAAFNEAVPGRPAYADNIDRATLHRWISGDTVEMDLGYRPARF